MLLFIFRKPTPKQAAQAAEDKTVVQMFSAKKQESKKKNVTKPNDGKDDRNKTSDKITKCQEEATTPKPSDATAHEYQTRYAFC